MEPAGFRCTAKLDRSHSPEFTEPSGRGPDADPERRCPRFGNDTGVLTDSGQQLIYSLTPVRKGKHHPHATCIHSGHRLRQARLAKQPGDFQPIVVERQTISWSPFR